LIRMLSTLLMVAILAPAAYGQSIIVEAETFVAWHNEGGIAFDITPCGSASGGYALEGLDYVGDWIEIVVDIPEIGAYGDSLRSAGLTGEQSQLLATVFGAGPGGGDLDSDYQTTGFGIY
jgi:hypothetical protein